MSVRQRLTEQYYYEVVYKKNPLRKEMYWAAYVAEHEDAGLDVATCCCSYECRLMQMKVVNFLRIAKNAGIEVTEKENVEGVS